MNRMASATQFTRLPNTFSNKVDNLRHPVALHFMHCTFCRVHQTLRVTPAMEAGTTDHVWSIEEVISLLGKHMPLERNQTKGYSNMLPSPSTAVAHASPNNDP